MNHKGFSLIELMAVIAIIGILSSVSLASMVNVRKNARDKSIQTSMQGILIEAAIFKAKNAGLYTGMCADANITTLTTKINADNGAYGAPTCTVTGTTKFGIIGRLNSGTYYCVDSNKYFGPNADANLASGLCH